jgi:metal-responsive CopG/Arc/MetJ family transcriptional regulator
LQTFSKLRVSITDEMAKKLEEERKKRLLDSVPETIRVILSEYLSKKS